MNNYELTKRMHVQMIIGKTMDTDRLFIYVYSRPSSRICKFFVFSVLKSRKGIYHYFFKVHLFYTDTISSYRNRFQSLGLGNRT
jgi:hypothetical protein